MRNYYTSPVLGHYSDPDGKELETTFGYCMSKTKIRHIESTIGTDLDTYEGTDFIVEGYPCDVTMRPKKDNEILSAKKSSFEFAGYSQVQIEYGIRTGNRHHVFEEPVAVIHLFFNTYDRRHNDEAFEKALTQHMPEIIKNVETVYEDYLDLAS